MDLLMFPYNLKFLLWSRISHTNLEGCFEKQLINWYSEGFSCDVDGSLMEPVIQ